MFAWPMFQWNVHGKEAKEVHFKKGVIGKGDYNE